MWPQAWPLPLPLPFPFPGPSSECLPLAAGTQIRVKRAARATERARRVRCGSRGMGRASVSADRLISTGTYAGTNVQPSDLDIGSQPATLRSKQDGVSPVRHAELAVHVVHVASHRALREAEVSGD